MWLQPCEKKTGDCNIQNMLLQHLMCSNCEKRQLQNQDVGDCLRPYSSVIATAAYVCFGKKRKKITEPVCDCNNSANVIATSSYVCCKNGNLTLSVCLQSYLVVWNMIASLGSK
jgi:hypothetical protein